MEVRSGTYDCTGTYLVSPMVVYIIMDAFTLCLCLSGEYRPQELCFAKAVRQY